MWAGATQLIGSNSAQEWLGWADLGPTNIFFFLGVGRTRPSHLGWAKLGPTHHISELFVEREQFTFCM
jgi:hypothetical protein